jgi:hypothetical protein
MFSKKTTTARLSLLLLLGSLPLTAADPVSEVRTGAMTSRSCQALMKFLTELRAKTHSAEEVQRLRSQAMAALSQPALTAARSTLGLAPGIDPEFELRPLEKKGLLATVLQTALTRQGASTAKERAAYLRSLTWNQRDFKDLATEMSKQFKKLCSEDPSSLKNITLAKQLGISFEEFKHLANNAAQPEFFELYLRSQVGPAMEQKFMAMATGEHNGKTLSALLSKNAEIPPDFSPLAQTLLEDGYVDAALRDVLAQMGFTNQHKMEEALEEATKDPNLIEELTTKVLAHLEAHFEFARKVDDKVLAGWPERNTDPKEIYSSIAPAVAARIAFTSPRELAKTLRQTEKWLTGSPRKNATEPLPLVITFPLAAQFSASTVAWLSSISEFHYMGPVFGLLAPAAFLLHKATLRKAAKEVGRSPEEVEDYIDSEPLNTYVYYRDIFHYGTYEEYLTNFQSKYPSLLKSMEPSSPSLSSPLLDLFSQPQAEKPPQQPEVNEWDVLMDSTKPKTPASPDSVDANRDARNLE